MDPDPINGGAIYGSSNGSQSSDGSAVAAGLLAGKLIQYFGVKIDSWFTSSFDQAAFNAARDMQMAMIQIAATFSGCECDKLYVPHGPDDVYIGVENRWYTSEETNVVLDDFGQLNATDSKSLITTTKIATALVAPEWCFVGMMSQASNHDEMVLPIIGLVMSDFGKPKTKRQ